MENSFASSPPELRPQQKSWKSGLRKVTCPGCGTTHWTNRETVYWAACPVPDYRQQDDASE